jgi:hypothetical protein
MGWNRPHTLVDVEPAYGRDSVTSERLTWENVGFALCFAILLMGMTRCLPMMTVVLKTDWGVTPSAEQGKSQAPGHSGGQARWCLRFCEFRMRWIWATRAFFGSG